MGRAHRGRKSVERLIGCDSKSPPVKPVIAA
jgi:hypothetical protein